MTSTATIFYINEQWLSNHDDPFGVRYDAQILPTGSVVVGFMKWDAQSESVQELIEAPHRSPNQEEAWSWALDEARTILRGEPFPVR